MLLPDTVMQVIAMLLLRLPVFQVIKDSQEQEDLGHYKEDDKEGLPPAVNNDMIAVFRLDIDKGIIGGRL